MMKFLHVIFYFILISACGNEQNHSTVTRVENNSRNDIVVNLLNSLDLKTKKAVNACIGNWDASRNKREDFWVLVGGLDSYENYIILEFGNTEHVLYEGFFLGKKNSKWHAYSSKNTSFIPNDNVHFKDLFKNINELKGYSFNETIWPATCKILSMKSDNIEREIVSFSMLNLLNYEKFNDLDLNISELDHLMIKLESFFERNKSG